MARVKKVVKSKKVPRKWLWWYRLIQFRRILCWFLVNSGWGNTNWPELLLLKFLPSTYAITAISWPPPQLFSHWPFRKGPYLFNSQAVFEYISVYRILKFLTDLTRWKALLKTTKVMNTSKLIHANNIITCSPNMLLSNGMKVYFT